MIKKVNMKDAFLEKIEAGTITIGIIGLGYVGLPLAEAYIRKNTRILGYDINQGRVDDLMSGKSGMKHIRNERVQSLLDSGLFRATSNSEELKDPDAILICVPTPLDEYLQPDLSNVRATCQIL